MRIITLKHLHDAAKTHRDIKEEIQAWATIVKACRWRNFLDVKARFPGADAVDGYTIFNFGWNRYRLVTVIHYAKNPNLNYDDGRIYIRSFLTHKQYDNRSNWDRRYGQ